MIVPSDELSVVPRLGPPASWSVSAGRSLLPRRWPTGAHFAAAISVDLDHETPWEHATEVSPQALSAADYGTRRGLRRIADVLDDVGVNATFFVPAIALRRYPGESNELLEAGHEIALHGLDHERLSGLAPSREREALLMGVQIFENVLGRKPKGFRAASFDPSNLTVPLLDEFGFTYDSSLMADDDPHELLLRGERSRVVEIPVEWSRDDATYFLMDRWTSLRPMASPETVAQIWRTDWHRARSEGGVFQLVVHPDLIGHRSRIHVLELLLSELREDGKCWFATHEEIALYCKEESQHGAAER